MKIWLTPRTRFITVFSVVLCLISFYHANLSNKGSRGTNNPNAICVFPHTAKIPKCISSIKVHFNLFCHFYKGKQR